MSQYCFGIDVGGTTIKCGLFTAEGEILEKWEITTRKENNGVLILPDVADTVKEMMSKRNLQKEEVAGIGIGVPGPVKEDGTLDVAVNIGWGYKDIVGELELATGLAVKAANDANIAALGEMWKGGGKGCRNLVFVTLGTGVGGGVIVDGRIIAGAHGAGGEIGHILIDGTETERCNCGNRGCLEQSASATGIVRLAKREMERSSESTLLEAEDLSAKSVFDACKAGDKTAVRIVEQFAKRLGETLAMIACVADPDVVVVGGGVSKAGDILTDILKKYFQENAFSSCKETDIVLAQLGNDAGIYGAAKLALNT